MTVVEWGEGKTEALSDSRLEVEVRRARGGTAPALDGAIDLAAVDDGRRDIVMRPFGQRWDGVLEAVVAAFRRAAPSGDGDAVGSTRA